MPRFFVAPRAIAADTITLSEADAHHAATVLRLAPGAAVTVCDGTGEVYACEVVAIAKKAVELRVTGRETAAPFPIPITLFQALPKGDKLDWIWQKATELGASHLVPLAAARSVVKIEANKAEAKLGRWRAIVREAAEQSERATLPEVAAPMGLETAIACLAPGALVLVLAERHAGEGLLMALPESPPPGIALFIGPEGGWTPEERTLLEAHGVRPVSLGCHILRTETAEIAATAVVMAKYVGYKGTGYEYAG